MWSGIASCTLVSRLPQSLPPLPPGPAPTCVPCVEGQQRAAPHSSELPPTEAPLHTLHMEVWGPAHVRGQGHEHYFLLVVDDYSRYTIVFPLHHKDKSGEFSSDLLRAFCRAEGIRQTFTLPASPNNMGLLSAALACTLRIRSTFSLVSPCWRPHLLCGGEKKVGDASVFCVWGSRAFVRDTSADKLSSRAVPCVFLGCPPDAPGWHFYHPTSRRVLSSQDVTFDESVSYYHPVEPVEVAVDSGTARGAEPAGAGPGGAEHGVAESEGAEPGGAEPERVEPGGAEPGGVESGGGADAAGAAGAAGPGGAGAGGAGAVGSPTGVGAAGGASGVGAAGGAAGARAARAGGAGAGGTGPVGGPAGVGAAGGAGAAGPGGARTEGIGAARAGAEGTGAVSAVSGGAARPRPYRTAPSAGSWSPAFYWSYSSLTESTACQSQSQLQPASPLPGSSPYSGPTRGLTKRRELESRPASPESRPESPVRTGHRVPRQHPPPIHGTHSMTLRPSTAPQHVPLPSPPASSLPALADPESDSLRTASPTVTRLLATVVIDPSFESTAASALVAELVAFAALCRLDYATSLVA
ncbi:unnamed protein product [Closterium sp. NIES-53]